MYQEMGWGCMCKNGIEGKNGLKCKGLVVGMKVKLQPKTTALKIVESNFYVGDTLNIALLPAMSYRVKKHFINSQVDG